MDEVASRRWNTVKLEHVPSFASITTAIMSHFSATDVRNDVSGVKTLVIVKLIV